MRTHDEHSCAGQHAAYCGWLAGGLALSGGVAVALLPTAVVLPIGLASISALFVGSALKLFCSLKGDFDMLLDLCMIVSVPVAFLGLLTGGLALACCGATAFSTVCLGSAATAASSALGLGFIGPKVRAEDAVL